MAAESCWSGAAPCRRRRPSTCWSPRRSTATLSGATGDASPRSGLVHQESGRRPLQRLRRRASSGSPLDHDRRRATLGGPLHCDSSALVKLYVQESGTDWMRRFDSDVAQVLYARVSAVEIVAALSPTRRRTRLADRTDAVAERWPPSAATWPVACTLVEVTESARSGLPWRSAERPPLGATMPSSLPLHSSVAAAPHDGPVSHRFRCALTSV